MFLITNGKRRTICMLCAKLHGPKDCPRRKPQKVDVFMEAVRLAKQINQERYAAKG